MFVAWYCIRRKRITASQSAQERSKQSYPTIARVRLNKYLPLMHKWPPWIRFPVSSKSPEIAVVCTRGAYLFTRLEWFVASREPVGRQTVWSNLEQSVWLQTTYVLTRAGPGCMGLPRIPRLWRRVSGAVKSHQCFHCLVIPMMTFPCPHVESEVNISLPGRLRSV